MTMNAPASHLRVLRAPARCLAAGLYGPSYGPSYARLAVAAVAKPSPFRCASTLPSTSTSSSASSSTALEKLPGATANPPHTTRPPPLTLPDRTPASSTASHLFATGKAYLAFYKTGLKYLFANTKLVKQVNAAEQPLTRSDLVLKHRWTHDMRRLPLFGLLLLICGEFTPFVVMVFPHVVPYPCRIPKQVESLRRADEKRRSQAFDGAGAAETETNVLISRSLGLAPIQDRLGLLSAVPSLAVRVADRRVRFLAEDDALLRAAGGVAALETEEVVLACTDRGLDVLGKDEAELRPLLTRWLEYTKVEHSAEPTDKYVHDRITTLLTRRPDAWP
ncbi:letm1-like protein [Ophiostoma piceae UAMH 11346]|uniref:Letm1-like protein n=1 Tax=Ophiostoma piceae (strain UAMH 11346) TaxID=1262450 RepID=S3CP54_OPHP1|nr:letm1-like protein [Ophiostoma piceae UAMH 11346]